MRIVQINTVYTQGSTGKIAAEIQEETIKQGYENIVAYRYSEGESKKNTYCISTWLDCHIHNRIARYTHLSGFYSRHRTARFIKYLEKIQPDIIHIHNLHGSYINVVKLFHWIAQNKIRTLWTFHDCWAFTGYCPYFELAHCEQWREACSECCYESSVFNRRHAARALKIKKEMVRGVDLTVVVPSKWMEGLVKETFYSASAIKVIPNGIDLSIFHPVRSNVKEHYRISASKYILLGVASVWNKRKGLDVFFELAKRLDPRVFQIVLVGSVPKGIKEKEDLIVFIDTVRDQNALAEIYSAADLFVNPTREETLGMVNIEANACGIPVVTFNTGGSPECIDDTSGSVIDKDDVDAMEREIIRICEIRPYTKQACVERARSFDQQVRFQEYVELYKELMDDRTAKS